MGDDRFVRDYGTGSSAEEHMEYEGWYEEEPGDMEPRYARDPGAEATDDPLYAKQHGRWGTSHYSPAGRVKEVDPTYVELIQQMPPIAATHKRALTEEIGALEDPALRGLPLFDAAPPLGAWRGEELARIPEKATRDWYYSTHWEEKNPVEHIRGYYDMPELRRFEPPAGQPKPLSAEQSTFEDFLNAGYTSRVDVVPTPGGDSRYMMSIYDPDGNPLLPPTQIWQARTGPGGTGGQWADHAGGWDTAARDDAIRRHVDNQLDRAARADVQSGFDNVQEQTMRGLILPP
jgi:hypothetical protein